MPSLVQNLLVLYAIPLYIFIETSLYFNLHQRFNGIDLPRSPPKERYEYTLELVDYRQDCVALEMTGRQVKPSSGAEVQPEIYSAVLPQGAACWTQPGAPSQIVIAVGRQYPTADICGSAAPLQL